MKLCTKAGGLNRGLVPQVPLRDQDFDLLDLEKQLETRSDGHSRQRELTVRAQEARENVGRVEAPDNLRDDMLHDFFVNFAASYQQGGVTVGNVGGLVDFQSSALERLTTVLVLCNSDDKRCVVDFGV